MLRLSMIRLSIIDIRKRVYTSAYFMFQNSYQNGNYFDLLDPKRTELLTQSTLTSSNRF